MSEQNREKRRYRSLAEIRNLVEKFEECAVAPSDFKHDVHLVVALWYLTRRPEGEAVELMRNGLRRLTARYDLNGYHETITLFWLKLTRRFLDELKEKRALPDIANQLVSAFGDSRLIFDYYSQALLQSPAAKAAWVEPDLKPLD